ncbi:MAG: diguanylate cyclase, partial [Deltaproteobacteria bacterium]|nr:diguanylate cyclase [Deltaproteobacteria bacterium]
MSFDAFQAEKDILERGESLLADKKDIDFRKEYQNLLKSYGKLSKSSQRLVKLSDRNEEGLKEANIRIQQQQAELEKTHKKLEEHALLLEEKVRERTKELVAAQGKLQKLVELGIALSMERNHASFMEMILRGAKELTNADGGILFSLQDDDKLHHE